ncbi:16S rRNA (cytosine(967)-C(5))-methyltransferase RsmB [Desulfarculus baarsii]
MNPRLTALDVLVQLESSPKHLDKLLSRAFQRHPAAQARDKAMATNLTHTVLRHRAWLDHLLTPLVSRPLAKLDAPVRAALRLGAAELVVLATPAHAAVGATVEAVKAGPAAKASGLVNGVLRALTRALPAAAQAEPPGDELDRLCLRHSHPRWLLEPLARRFGLEQAAAWAQANQSQPPLCLRVNALKASPAQVAESLAPVCEAVEAHALAPEALIVRGAAGPLWDLPGFREGLWQAQDAGAQALGRLLGVGPGMTVLDLCAGAGGKSGHLAALMANQGRIVAVDDSAGRLEALAENMARLGVTIVEPVLADGAAWDGGGRLFEAILVDAPCSGLGVIGRRPDIRWRRSPADSAAMARIQLALARNAARLLAPGGALVYCTCTVAEAENEGVARALLAARPELRPSWAGAEAAGEMIGADGFWRSFPRPMAADSFFAARLVRV